MTTETEIVELIRELVESAIKDHCSGADLYMASKIGAEKIAAAHAREVELLKQANIAYSSENANMRGRAMAAEKDAARLDWLEINSDWVCLRRQDDGDGGHIYPDNIAPDRSSIDAAMGEPVREVLR